MLLKFVPRKIRTNTNQKWKDLKDKTYTQLPPMCRKVKTILHLMSKTPVMYLDAVIGRNYMTAMQCTTSTWPQPATPYFFDTWPDSVFENHRVAGNPKYWIVPDVLGKPEVSGITWYSQKWLGTSGKASIFGSLHQNMSYTQKYPKVKKMPKNTWS